MNRHLANCNLTMLQKPLNWFWISWINSSWQEAKIGSRNYQAKLVHSILEGVQGLVACKSYPFRVCCRETRCGGPFLPPTHRRTQNRPIGGRCSLPVERWKEQDELLVIEHRCHGSSVGTGDGVKFCVGYEQKTRQM